MGGLVLRRVGQGMLVILALSLIAFVGLYAIGDPTAILLDPQSTAPRTSPVSAPRWASTSRCGGNTCCSCFHLAHGATGAFPSSTTRMPWT